MKRQAADLDERAAKPIANKGLASRTHKELFQLKTNNLVKKKKMNRDTLPKTINVRQINT